MTRTTGTEYRKQLQDLKEKTNALEARIKNRLLELTKQNPDVVISRIGDTNIKAKSVSELYANNADINTALEIIETIEKWLADKHPHVQLSIDYNS